MSFPFAPATSLLDVIPALGPLHAGSASPLFPHWAVLVVCVASLGAAIAVGVVSADRLLDRLVA